MTDLTILFYSACRVEEPFASRVREHLLSVIGDTPLVSVTHEALDFGENYVYAGQPVSAYTLYKQVLIAAKIAMTRYVACAEDDCLYTKSHFEMRPPDDETFIYNKARFWLEADGRYRWRDRTGFHACIAPREFLIDTLKKRFEKYPVHPEGRKGLDGWAEPGRYEWYLKLPKVKMEYVYSDEPVLTFNHKGSLGGQRKTRETDIIKTDLEPWGSAAEVWHRFHD